MTFEQYHNLIDKYGIEVDADLYLCYRNYLLGRIETDETYEDPNRHVTFVTYDNNGILYPICNIDENNFHISEVTNNVILILVSQVINQCGKSLEYQLNKQGFLNKPLNKLTDGK